MGRIHMIVFNADFPRTCKECPIRAAIGCDLSYQKEGILDSGISDDCPFEPAEPVEPFPESCGVFHAPPNSYTVAEMICVKCLHRFIDVRPEGLLLKDMECPFCHLTGFLIETGEYMTGDDE